MVDPTNQLAADVAREMNEFGGLKRSMADNTVGEAFRSLRQYLDLDANPWVYRTVFYDMSKKAGGDGMSGGSLNKMHAATVNLCDEGRTDEQGNKVYDHSDRGVTHSMLPFIMVDITEDTRPKLIVLKEFYSADMQVSVKGNRAYITFNRSFF